MKKLLFILLLPFLTFGQLTEKETLKLDEILSQAEGLSEYDYKLAVSMSDSLMVAHPNDSLVLVNRVRLFHIYVKKSKCQPHNYKNVCDNALEFYNVVSNKIAYPRLSVAKGMVYYNWSKYNDKPTKKEAISQFNTAITTADLADFEKLRLQTFIERLN